MYVTERVRSSLLSANCFWAPRFAPSHPPAQWGARSAA